MLNCNLLSSFLAIRVLSIHLTYAVEIRSLNTLNGTDALCGGWGNIAEVNAS